MNTERTSILVHAFSRGRAAVLAFGLALVLTASAHAEVLTLVLTTNLFEPYGLVVTENNRIFVADSANNRIVRYNQASGLVEEFAGRSGSDNKGAVDNTGTLARFYGPQGLVMSRGLLVVADTANNLIRTIDTNGVVLTVAGNLGLAFASHEIGEEPDNFGFKDAANGVNGQLHAPSGLAVDGDDIYIADSLNGAIRKLSLATKALTTLSVGFNRPSAVAVGPAGTLFVADAATHSIYRLTPSTNGYLRTLLAGGNSTFLSGYKDSDNATSALFNNPRGLLYKSSGELLVADAGNGLIRRITDADTASPMVSTIPIAGAGVALISPVAMAYDLDDVLVVSDRKDNALKGFLPPASNQKQVQLPIFGTVDFPLNGCGATLSPLQTGTFNNDPVIAIRTELGSSTYFTYSNVSDTEDLADPTTASLTPPAYLECQPGFPINLLAVIPGRSGHIVIKAISTQINRRASGVATAIFDFRCANPVVNGSNPVQFGLSTDTRDAELWYTVGPTQDIPDPSPTNAVSHLFKANTPLNVFLGSDVSIKVRAFRVGYLPSAVTTHDFKVTDAKINSVGFTRDFKGAPGSLIVLPIELQPAPSNALRSVQFRVEVISQTNRPTPSLGTFPVRSDSFILVNPAGFNDQQGVSYSIGTTNGLGLAYLSSGPGSPAVTSTSVVTMLSVRLPGNATNNEQYSISVLQASATSDGVNTDVAMTNFPIRHITIDTNLSYLVGDSAHAFWYNSGEFGDHDLKNDDVNGVFLATLGYRTPYAGTDAFDAMDAFPVDSVERPGGDGQLRYLDFQLLLLRSLRIDPGNWTRRRDSHGDLMATPLGQLPGATLSSHSGKVSAKSSSYPRSWARPARVEAHTVTGIPQSITMLVPVYVVLQPGTTVSGLQFVARVVAPAGSPAIDSLNFAPGESIPPADRSGSQEPASLFVSWNLGAFTPALSGTTLLGNLYFKVPAGATSGTAYSVRIDHADGAPDIRTSIDWETLSANVWVSSAALQPDNPLPPEWREYFFGPLLADSILPSSDDDGDGASNYTEYLAGTDPTKSDLKLEVTSGADGFSQVKWFGHKTVKYSLQSSSSPAGPWLEVSTPLLGGNDWMTLLRQSPVGNNAQFFRMSAIPQN